MIDGEVVAFDQDGRPSVQRTAELRLGTSAGPLAFDVVKRRTVDVDGNTGAVLDRT